MIKDMKVTKNRNYDVDEIILTTSIDMVLLFTDNVIVDIVKDTPSLKIEVSEVFKYISSDAMMPICIGRYERNMLDWIQQDKYKGSITMDQIRHEYAKRIYSEAQPTKIGANLITMLTSKNSSLKTLNVIVDADKEVAKYQIEKIVELYGRYAYRINIVTPESNNYTDIIKAIPEGTTSIMHNDYRFIKTMDDEGIDLNTLSFIITKIGYNLNWLATDGDAHFNIELEDIVEKYKDMGLAMAEIFDFTDNKYFTMG